jgi:predicted ArsR family transcriptional regulator
VPEGRHEPEQDTLLEVLSDARRRAVYEFVLAAGRALTRDEVAEGLGITRPSAAFHLDKLAEVAAMSVTFARPPGRSGPGAGRPAKRYSARGVDLEISVPPRRYRELADVLAETAASIDDETDRFMERASDAAYSRGVRQAGEGLGPEVPPLDRVSETLDRLGYVTDRSEPYRLVLRNCPFRSVADASPEVVCTLNERYVAGVVAGLGLGDELRIVGDGLAPACCVTVSLRG